MFFSFKLYKKLPEAKIEGSDQFKNKRLPLALWTMATAVAILGLSYAFIPLYKQYCQTTIPINSTTKQTQNGTKIMWKKEESQVDARSVAVYFYANVDGHAATVHMAPDQSSGVPSVQSGTFKKLEYHNNEAAQLTSSNAEMFEGSHWIFKPTVQKIAVYPGDTALVFYNAQNLSGTAGSCFFTYHINPPKAGIYFNKIQCFCFEEQRFKINETIEMPVLFYIDPDFEKDPKMEDVKSIILTYNLINMKGA